MARDPNVSAVTSRARQRRMLKDTAAGARDETAARRAVTGRRHWGRTEHRARALRYHGRSLAEALHHHTQWEGYGSVGRAAAADGHMCDARTSP